ncbi:fumarate hydratase [Streptomyces samsunensis]|uniref:fumarate hydratase n=1 Tax=Streptomyces malaysiensis TaxID=92644 RepID=UPI0015835167|nr:fumarate hydratase [Streptomyces samsunensis]NUH42634.1 fumarate hydratase [Streptomyces samsunensis]
MCHLLRTSHLEQLRAIVDDSEASPNDRYMATNLPAQIEIMTEGQDTYEFLFMAKGGGSEDAGPLDSVTRHTQNHYTSA